MVGKHYQKTPIIKKLDKKTRLSLLISEKVDFNQEFPEVNMSIS